MSAIDYTLLFLRCSKQNQEEDSEISGSNPDWE